MARPLKALSVARRSAVIACLAAVCVLSSATASTVVKPAVPGAITDNETVYVIADATGAPRTTVVVDWLQVSGTGTFRLADPAPGIGAIESLTDGFAPAYADDVVTAEVTVDGNGDFFYRAETTAELPIDIRLAYFLDGTATAPAELAGRSGRLRIEIAITNRLERTETITYAGSGGAEESAEVTYTVPMLCIPQFKIDGTRMTDIEAPESAQLAISGSTLTYALPMVPSPEATAFLEMDARDIELDSLIVSAFPKLPASPDFSVAAELLELRDGLADLRLLSEGHLQVVEGIADGMSAFDVSGAAGAAGGLAALESGLGELGEGAEGLAALTDGQYAYLAGVISAIDTSQFDSLGQLSDAVTQMRVVASQIETGTAGLLALVDGQIQLAETIRGTNAGLMAAAAALPASMPSTWAADPAAAPLLGGIGGLAAGLGAQDAMLGALLDGGDLGGGYMPGLRFTREQLAAIGEGVGGLRFGLEQLEAQAEGLSAVPDAFGRIRSALVVLRDGGTVGGQTLPGLGATRAGLTGLAGGLSAAESGLASSAGDLARLAELPQMMGELGKTLDALARGGSVRGQHLPGLSTTVEALGTVSSGLGEGVDDIRKGEALTEAMSRAADGYTTFLGLPEGATGQLSFLFRIDGVQAADD